MRTKFSELSTIPFYTSRQEQHLYTFDSNVPVLLFPDFASIKFQLIFKNDLQTYQGATIKSDTATYVPDSVSYNSITQDVDNDGNDEFFLQFDGFTYAAPPTEDKYWIELLINGVTYYSEVFFICSAKYKIEWYDDCSSKDFGNFDSGWKNILYLNDFFPTVTNIEEQIEERADGYGNNKKIYQRSEIVYTAQVKGSNFLRHAFNNIKYYDNIELTHIASSQTWTIYDLKGESGGGNGAYALDISYKTEDYEKLECNISAYENAPYTDPDTPSPGDLTCGAFAVTIVQTGFQLSYTLSNDPDATVVEDITWTRNGRFLGKGSTVTLGDFGNYGVRIQKKNCIVTDYYNYQDVCIAMQTSVSVNNDIINASTSNAPSSVSYEVYNPSGSLVSSSLPYTAVADGVHTVKVASGDCEKIYNVPVNITGSVDCSFTFELSKDASNTLSVVNNTAVTYSVEWFKVINGNEEVSVGTGDTHDIDGEGLFIARMTSSGCSLDVLYVYLETAVNQGFTFQLYERSLNYSGSNYDVANFTLPHPSIFTEDEIDDRLRVVVNGVTYAYKGTTTAINEYTIDFANNRITPHVAFATDDIQLYRTFIKK